MTISDTELSSDIFIGHREDGARSKLNHTPPDHRKPAEEIVRKKSDDNRPGETRAERNRRIASETRLRTNLEAIGMKSALAGAGFAAGSRIITDAQSRRTEALADAAHTDLNKHGNYVRRYNDAIQRCFDMGTMSDGGSILDEMARTHGKSREQIAAMLKSPSAQSELGLSDEDFGKLRNHVQEVSMAPEVTEARENMNLTGTAFEKTMLHLIENIKNEAASVAGNAQKSRMFTGRIEEIKKGFKSRINEHGDEPIELPGNNGFLDSLTRGLEIFDRELESNIIALGDNLGNGFRKP